MENANKTKEGLIEELEALHQCVAELEKGLTEHQGEEQLLKAVLISSPIGTYIVQDGHFRFASHQFQQIAGYSENELIGTYCLNLVLPEDRDMVRQNAVKMLKGERSFGYEFRVVTKRGVSKWVMETVAPISYRGRRATLGNFVDISERKQVEENIKQAAEEWRATFDSITDLVSIQDKDFRLMRVNSAFADAFKMKPAELIGKPCYEIVHGANEPVPNCPHRTAIETKEPATTEFFEPQLGVYLEVSISPIFNEKGEVVASVHIAKDITERKQAEAQLIVTDRLASIGELASGIAHELNNPLTSVIGFAQLILDKDVADDVREDIAVIYREAQRTAEVVKNLLTFARKHTPVTFVQVIIGPFPDKLIARHAKSYLVISGKSEAGRLFGS